MKYFLIGTLMIVSFGCSNITFDSLNYDRYITLHEVASEIKANCGNYTFVKNSIKELKPQVEHMALYSKLRSNSPEVANVAKTVASMVDELAVKYSNEKEPSVAYCQEKLNNISSASYTIASTLGAQQ